MDKIQSFPMWPFSLEQQLHLHNRPQPAKALCWPQSPPRKTPQCIPAPAVALLLFLVLLLFLLTAMLSDHSSQPPHSLTLSLTCLGLGLIISPLLGEGRRKGKQGKKRRNCLENNFSLTPCSDSSGSALTRTAGIPSSINILFLRLPVNGYRGGVRRVFQHD